MGHIAYPKIHALYKEECDGILIGEGIIIQEKIDGANLSIWLEDGEIFVGSRTQIVGDKERKTGFRGAVEYVNAHPGIARYLNDNPTHRLFGEWLVKHTINYPEEYINKFYIYDILVDGEFIRPDNVVDIAKRYGIHYPQIFAIVDNPTLEQVKSYAGKSFLGNITGEGVVIKNHGFNNKFNNFTYGKYVTEEFKEKNSIEFHHTRTDDLELNFVVQFVNEARMMKLINKIEQNEQEGYRVSKKDIPKLFGLMWYDVFTEGLWEYNKKHRINYFDFKRAEKLCQDSTKSMFINYLDSTIK